MPCGYILKVFHARYSSHTPGLKLGLQGWFHHHAAEKFLEPIRHEINGFVMVMFHDVSRCFMMFHDLSTCNLCFSESDSWYSYIFMSVCSYDSHGCIMKPHVIEFPWSGRPFSAFEGEPRFGVNIWDGMGQYSCSQWMLIICVIRLCDSVIVVKVIYIYI